MAAQPDNVAVPRWTDANRDCLAKELRRIRLLMRRRACWLRKAWHEDALASPRGLVISDTRADQLLATADDLIEHAFHRDDAESRAITAELTALEHALSHERRHLESGGVAAIAVLQQSFGLGAFERDVLLLCLAVAEDAAFATLCAYLQDDASATRVSIDLALELFCQTQAERVEARLALAPTAPLRHFRLVRLSDDESGATRRNLRIDERVADFIRGLDRLDERVGGLLRSMPRPAICGAHEDLVVGLMHWAEALPAQPWPILNFTGAVGCGRRAVAAELCRRLGLQPLTLDPRSIPQLEGERQEFVHLLQREAALSRLAFCIDITDLDVGDRVLGGAVRDFMERFTGVLFVSGRERWRFTRPAVHVEVPRPNAAEQQMLWKRALNGVAGSVEAGIDDIVQQFDFGPEAIPQVVQTAVARTRRNSTGISLADLWAGCRDYTGAQLGSLAERLTPGCDWDDIVLPTDVLTQVRELAAQVSQRTTVYERWGFGKRLARGRGIAALFSGPSGTGKTMTAEILARALDLDLYRIDLAGVVSKYIGETEKNLRNIFDAAEQSGAILFFDEADALFGKRTEVRDSHDRYANIEINYLLQRMEDYRGLAILCTNRRNSLDRAFLRRLRFLIEFPFPDAEHRLRIWRKMFPPAAPLGALDFDALARLEVPGGNIRNIALNAAFLAAGSREPIADAHVLHAARREYAKIDKLLTPAEFGADYYKGNA